MTGKGCDAMSRDKKNLRRLSVLVTAQTAGNLKKLTAMAGFRDHGRTIDKLVREKMLSFRERKPLHGRSEE